MFTRFNVGAMWNEVSNIYDPEFLGEKLLYDTSSGFFDCHFGIGRVQAGTAIDHKIAAREYFREKALAHLKKSDLFIMTLGLAEAFFDVEDQLYLNAPPPAKLALDNPERFQARLIDYPETIEYLEKIREILKKIQPSMNILVTVSPVALGKTFSGSDIVVANCESKAILRAAAGKFTSSHDDTFYFPSYESVTGSDHDFAYRWDKRHVKRDMVDRIIGKFCSIVTT